jgi:hypothetical protein
MIRIFIGTILLVLSVFPLLIYMAGSHGHLMFRPHMPEDWVIWGAAVILLTSGALVTAKGINRKGTK